MGGVNGARAAVARMVEAVRLPARDRAEIGLPGGPSAVAVAGAAGPVAGLAEALYGHFYCVPAPEKVRGDMDPVAFLAALRAANPVPARAMDGWTIVQAEAAGIFSPMRTGAAAARRWRRSSRSRAASRPGSRSGSAPSGRC